MWRNLGVKFPFSRTGYAMSERSDIDRVWELLEKAGAGMLTTRFAGGLRARPVEPRPDRTAGTILFVTDVHSHKDDDIGASPDVGFVVIDAHDKAYLSITGRASIRRDGAAARAIWKKTDDVWWPGGPDDPNVRVLVLEPATAELWDGPSSSLVAAYEFAKARMTGEKPDLGENRKTTVRMGR
jgi:general stress protein 26